MGILCGYGLYHYFSRTQTLNYNNLMDLPKLMKRYKENIYNLFNNEDLDTIYWNWLQALQHMLRALQHIQDNSIIFYSEILGDFFNYGVNKLNKSYQQYEIVLLANHFAYFLNKDSYNFYIKEDIYLPTIAKHLYFADLQQFMTKEELIEYAYDGYKIDLEQIEDSNLKNTIIFIQEVK